jgi:hypothetical protein
MPFASDDKHDEGEPDRREYPENGTAEVAFVQQRISPVSSRKSLRINSAIVESDSARIQAIV